VDADPQPFDLRLECQAAEVIQLHRHQARCEFDNMGFHAQAFERVGRLKAQQTTAHHHATSGIDCRSPYGVEVFKGSIHQA